MGIETISWKSPRPTDGTGTPVNEGVDLPRMKGRKEFNPRQELKRLKGAIADLCDTPCCFWACEGPNRPRSMMTCTRCWNLRMLQSIAVTLERSLTAPPEPEPPTPLGELERELKAVKNALPESNMFWKDIQPGDKVIDTGLAYVVIRNRKRYTVCWEGREVARAMEFLKRRSRS